MANTGTLMEELLKTTIGTIPTALIVAAVMIVNHYSDQTETKIDVLDGKIDQVILTLQQHTIEIEHIGNFARLHEHNASIPASISVPQESDKIEEDNEDE